MLADVVVLEVDHLTIEAPFEIGAFNHAAYAALGEPVAIELLYDREE